MTDNSELIQLQQNRLASFIFLHALTHLQHYFWYCNTKTSVRATQLSGYALYFFWAEADSNLWRDTLTLTADFRALAHITQSDFFIFFRLIHNDFLPNPFQLIADQSTCLPNSTVEIPVQCTESCITNGARKWITVKFIPEDSAAQLRECLATFRKEWEWRSEEFYSVYFTSNNNCKALLRNVCNPHPVTRGQQHRCDSHDVTEFIDVKSRKIKDNQVPCTASSSTSDLLR